MRGVNALFLSLVLTCGAAASEPIKRALDPSISPDGNLIAFTYEGDIWVVSADGGQARRLTVHPAEDQMPVWGPNSDRIAFASNRFGNLDVFSMNATGGDLMRLTFESSSEYPNAFSPDGAHLYGYTNGFGRLGAFRVRSSGGDVVPLAGHPLEMEYYISVSPDGSTVAYNQGGSPGHWRKPGHFGANTSEVWIADATVPLSNMRRLTENEAYDNFPVFVGEDRVAFVSNRDGQPNIWSQSVGGSDAVKHTDHTSGTLRWLSTTADGSKIAYQHDSGVWVHDVAAGTSEEVEIHVPSDRRGLGFERFDLTRGISDYAVSPDGKRTVIVVRGELFLMPENGGTTRRLTDNPGWDYQPTWLDDETVLYTSATENSHRVLKTVTIDGEIETFLKDDQDLFAPAISPDGEWIAVHRGIREIVVMPKDASDMDVVVEGSFTGALFGGSAMSWTHDSEWLLINEETPLNSRAVLLRRDGSDRIEVGRVGKGMGTAHMTPDGEWVFFNGTQGIDFDELRRSQSPMYAVRLNPEPLEFDEDDLDAIDEPGDRIASDEMSVTMRGLDRRMRKLTSATAVPLGARDETHAYANVGGQFSIVNLETGQVRPAGGVSGNVSNVQTYGNRHYFLQGGRLFQYDPNRGNATPADFDAEFEVDFEAEKRALFNEMWWTLDRGFYDETKHGKDWESLRAEYEPLIAHAPTRGDFYDLAYEMLMRLDSSHIGTNSPGGWSPEVRDSTGWLGVMWDPSALDARGHYVVQTVMEGGPASHPDSSLLVGDRIVSVDGVEPSHDKPIASLLNLKAGHRVTLEVKRGTSTMEMDIRPASRGMINGLGYQAWVDFNKDLVDRLSNGRLAYVHIQGMNANGVNTFWEAIANDVDDKDGILVDVRYNGGGFTAHIMLNILFKTPWLIRTSRGMPGVEMSENSYRGNALELPAAALINEYSFSNAEIFAEGFRRLGIGPVIGERTGGGVIGTFSIPLWDGGNFRLPGGGAYTIDGENLENNGRRPDVDVDFDPNAWMNGQDPQLEAAVRTLLSQIDD